MFFSNSYSFLLLSVALKRLQGPPNLRKALLPPLKRTFSSLKEKQTEKRGRGEALSSNAAFKKMGDRNWEAVGETNKEGVSSGELKNNPIDLTDFKIVKEGDAEILMHAGNEVFYNKTQVNNRDMSIAVLRTFVSKRKEEHESKMARKLRRGQKILEEKTGKQDEEASSKRMENTDDSNGNLEEGVVDALSSVGIEEPVKPTEVKSKCELKPPRVLEALSASGLRSLRYAREVEGLGQIVALDNDEGAVESCRRNIKFNGPVACAKVESHLADARVYMLTHPNEFDVVDLDPYGSPSVFLDSAIQSVADGGMLICTATDMAVLCGGNGNSEVCYSKYGSYPLKAKYCHEMALRILLACIESHANRYKRYIVPVLSVQMDFYVRVFVRVYTSAIAMKSTPLKLAYIYQCTGCDSFHLQPLGRAITKDKSVKYLPGSGPVVPQQCSDCGWKYNMGGPIWSAPIHDQEWVTSILADVKANKDRYPAYERIVAVLTTISEELPDIPLYLSMHNLCAVLKCTSPSAIVFRSAVLNAGYRISGTHVNPLGMKSDAPMNVIWDILRCWVKNHPVKAQPSVIPGSVILSKEPELQANFSQDEALAKAKRVVRFLPNPEKNWGPKLRAGRQVTKKHISILGAEAVNGSMRNNGENKQHDEDEMANGKRSLNIDDLASCS
ncbi:hypothetical protein V2J09_012655 [Rumex salicifolius]